MAIRLLSSETIDGNITVSGTAVVGNTLYLAEYIQHTGNTNNNIRFQTNRMQLFANFGTAGYIDLHDNGNVYIGASNATALTITSSSATFAGDVAIQSTIPKLSFTDLQQDDWDIINDNGEFKFLCSTGSGIALKLDTSNTATFGGNNVDVKGSSAGNTQIRITDSTGTTGTNSFDLINDGSAAYVWNRKQTDLNFATYGSLRMKIRASGTVGIGANGGYDSQMLSIDAGVLDGAIYATSSDANCFASFRDNSSTANIEYGAIGNSHVFRKDASVKMVIDADGDVGIGTASPSAKLEIVTAVGADAIRMNYGQSADIFLGFASANPRILLQDNSNVVTHNFQSNGDNYIVGSNVAIGTTVPDQTGYGYKVLTIMGGTTAGYAGTIELLAPSVDAEEQNYGILSFGAGGTRTGMISVNRQAANNAGNMRFWTAPGGAGIQERMRIDKDGNVGIGTTSPANKLTVNGDIGFTGFLGQGSIFGNTGNASYTEMQLYNPASGYTTIDNKAYGYYFATAGSTKLTILNNGNVGIGTTNPSSKLEVAGRAIVEKLEVARYSDSNAPAAVYVGRSANPMGQGGIFRLGAIESSSTVNKIDEPFLITYSSGHWGCQPMFFAEFTITYYRGSYIKYWAQHEVSGSRLEIVDGPYGGQIITGGAPVSRTITQLCTNCHGGQPVYKCVWKWSNSGTYIKTSPIVSLVDGHGSARVYTSGSSSESAIDTLLGSAGSPGPAYLLMGINNAQAAGFTGLQTQN